LLAPGRHKELGRCPGRLRHLFLGLSMLQDGMQVLGGQLQPGPLACRRVMAPHLLIMLTRAGPDRGAAVLDRRPSPVTLTALDAGAISFDQAAAIVVGASIGTTPDWRSGRYWRHNLCQTHQPLPISCSTSLPVCWGLLILPLVSQSHVRHRLLYQYLSRSPGPGGLSQPVHWLGRPPLCLPFYPAFARWYKSWCLTGLLAPGIIWTTACCKCLPWALETTQRTLARAGTTVC